jgi:hypothetical protein
MQRGHCPGAGWWRFLGPDMSRLGRGLRGAQCAVDRCGRGRLLRLTTGDGLPACRSRHRWGNLSRGRGPVASQPCLPRTETARKGQPARRWTHRRRVTSAAALLTAGPPLPPADAFPTTRPKPSPIRGAAAMAAGQRVGWLVPRALCVLALACGALATQFTKPKGGVPPIVSGYAARGCTAHVRARVRLRPLPRSPGVCRTARRKQQHPHRRAQPARSRGECVPPQSPSGCWREWGRVRRTLLIVADPGEFAALPGRWGCLSTRERTAAPVLHLWQRRRGRLHQRRACTSVPQEPAPQNEVQNQQTATAEAYYYLQNLKSAFKLPPGRSGCPEVHLGDIMGQPVAVVMTGGRLRAVCSGCCSCL